MFKKKWLTFSENLYLGNELDSEKLNNIKRKIQSKPSECGELCVICIASNIHDHLDIYEVKNLDQTYFKKNPPHIIAIASNHEEALQIVETIAGECLSQRGDLNLREYLNVNCG